MSREDLFAIENETEGLYLEPYNLLDEVLITISSRCRTSFFNELREEREYYSRA